MLSSLLSSNYLRPTVLIDGPCNEWWLNYGTEPNSATLIQPNGTVFAFQQWFDKAPENIFVRLIVCLEQIAGCAVLLEMEEHLAGRVIRSSMEYRDFSLLFIQRLRITQAQIMSRSPFSDKELKCLQHG